MDSVLDCEPLCQSTVIDCISMDWELDSILPSLSGFLPDISSQQQQKSIQNNGTEMWGWFCEKHDECSA